MTHRNDEDDVAIGDIITLVDDYTGESFAYVYKGGPRKRFATKENRERFIAWHLKHYDIDHPLELIDWLIDMNIIHRDKRDEYRVGGLAIPQHLHLLLDHVYETVVTDELDPGEGVE